MARPLLRQAALAGLLVAAAAVGVAQAALVEVGEISTPVNALNVGESTQNSGDAGDGGSGDAVLVDVDGVYAPVNAGNVGKSTQNTGDAGDGGSSEGVIVIEGVTTAVNTGNAGTSTQNVGGPGSGDGSGPSSSPGPLPTLIRIGEIYVPINALNIGDSCQSVGVATEAELCDPDRATDPVLGSGGLPIPTPAPGPGPNPNPNPAPGPGTNPGNPGGSNPGAGTSQTGTHPGTGATVPAPGRNGGTGPASQVSGSSLEVASAPLGGSQLRPEVSPSVSLEAPADPAPAPGAHALPGAGGVLGRTGFSAQVLAMIGLLLMLAGTLLALAMRRLTPARRTAPAR
jgi:hypothetical protein